jgi:PEP-CTERM motif
MLCKTTLTRIGALLAVTSAACLSAPAAALTIDFEGYAADGSAVAVTPGSPFTSSGFTITPSTSDSAVFDSASGSLLIGDATDWIGFAETNVLTLAPSGGGSFDLTSVLIGPSTIASATPIDISIDGNLAGGGTLNATYNSLSTATTATLDWTGLSSVTFTVTDDAGLDDIVVVATPEPGTLALLALGLAGLACTGRGKAG